MTVPGWGMPAASVPTIWGNVPRRNKNFTGRAEALARLRRGASSRVMAVLPGWGQEDPVPQAIHGLGEDTLPRLKALLGADHPLTLGCAANLALDMIAAGDAEGGRVLREDTLAHWLARAEDPEAAVAARGGRLNTDFDPLPI